MSSSSSITPVKNNTENTENKIIRYFLASIWGILILFGFISLLQPGWLVDISAEGKLSEALDYKTAGNASLQKGNFQAAAGQYIKAIKIQPDLTDAYGNLGISYTQLKRYDEALKIFRHLLKTDRKNMHTNYYNMAEIHKRQGDIDSAIDCYRKSAEINPFPIYSYQYLGEIYLKLKNWELAIKAFELALANKLTLENSYYGLLKGMEKTSADEPEIIEAVKLHLEQTADFTIYDNSVFINELKKDKEIAKTYNFLGYAFSKMNDFQSAKLNYKMALRIWPRFSEAKENLNAVNKLIK